VYILTENEAWMRISEMTAPSRLTQAQLHPVHNSCEAEERVLWRSCSRLRFIYINRSIISGSTPYRALGEEYSSLAREASSQEYVQAGYSIRTRAHLRL
jgi:hypothetical protein